MQNLMLNTDLLKLTSACAILALNGAAFGQFGQPAQSNPPATQQAPAQDVVAMVNGDPITMSEYATALDPQLKQIDPADAAGAQQVRQQVMNGLIESRLVEQYLIEEGPEIPKQEVSTVIDRYKQQIESQGIPFDQFMQSKGYSQEHLERRVEGSLAWQKFQQQELTEEKLQQHFEQNQAQFQTEKFEEVKPQVAQSYVGQLWTQIVNEVRPQAEIKVVQPEQPAGGAVPGNGAPVQ